MHTLGIILKKDHKGAGFRKLRVRYHFLFAYLSGMLNSFRALNYFKIKEVNDNTRLSK